MSKAVNFRLPEEDYAALEAMCSRQGLTVSDALKEAVRRWLGREVDPPPDPLGKVQQRLRAPAPAAPASGLQLQLGPSPVVPGSRLKQR